MGRGQHIAILKNSCLQHFAPLDGVIPLGQLANGLAHAGQINLCQKAQLAKIDAKGRHPGRHCIASHLQQRAIAAQAHRRIQGL